MVLGGQASSQSGAVNRLAVLAAVLFLCGAGIFARLVSLQIVQHDKYVSLARSQQEHRVDIPAPRGSIYDRNGQPLALSVPADSVSVNPLQISDIRVATELLGNMLHLDQQVLYERLRLARENHKGFLWIKKSALDPFEDTQPAQKALHRDHARSIPIASAAIPRPVNWHRTSLGGVYKGERGRRRH